MKKFALTILLMLGLAGSTFAQSVTPVGSQGETKFIEFTLVGTESETVYIKWPNERFGWQAGNVDTVAFGTGDFNNGDRFNFTGDLGLSLSIDTLVVEESDSLAVSMSPYTYDRNLGAWAVSINDTTHLVWDTQGVYAQSTIDWLDWATGDFRTCQLSNELWTFPGVAITFRQLGIDTATSAARVRLGITLIY